MSTLPSVKVAISTVSDGNMLIHEDKANKTVVHNRTTFLEQHGIPIDQATRVDIVYEGTDYRRYREVTKHDLGAGMYDGNIAPADALITRDANHALFLPLADCVGAVLFDPVNHILMLSHLGRHSVEQFSGQKSVEYLKAQYGSNPVDICVWLTPAPGKDTYPLWTFDNRSLKEVVIEQLRSAGIVSSNINNNDADTATDLRYFSHSQFLAGKRTEDGRYGIIAMMTK